MIRNGKAIDHSNVGGVWGSLIAFIVAFGAFLGCLYAMGFWSLESVWIPGLIALALATVAFMIPKAFLGRSDTVDTGSGPHGRKAPAGGSSFAIDVTRRSTVS